ncbi:MAG: UDP-N-acetylglucosamine 1-carboxyvinyltransferase [Clostridia bacterium]|nr:UDP-N-acetylglucosamine 1-carboxyvinyltransferase [Clostridia bacterium]
MSKFIVNSSRPLRGTVKVSGSKNSALPILSACLLSGGISVIKNVPDLSDVSIMCSILSHLGCKISRDGDVITVDSSNASSVALPYELTGKIRASFIAAGALLARFKFAEIALPGGCTIGTRPVDLHLKGFSALGSEHHIKDGFVYITCPHLKGTKICLDFPSVGATQNIMLASVLASGTTIIENCASEPEIADLADFLCKCGADISGAGTDKITINGVKSLTGCEHTIIPDRIEAGTFMVAAGATGGDIRLENVISSHLTSVTSKLCEIGINCCEFADEILVRCDGERKAATVKTMPFPGFPTDMQSQIAAMLCCIEGTSLITETIFENRFMYVPELIRMNADIKVDGRTAVIKGNSSLIAAQVNATDLRASAALIIAGMAAKGKTTINNADYLKRGYEHLDTKLKSLGADVWFEE